jgi:hypothetical protein
MKSASAVLSLLFCKIFLFRCSVKQWETSKNFGEKATNFACFAVLRNSRKPQRPLLFLCLREVHQAPQKQRYLQYVKIKIHQDGISRDIFNNFIRFFWLESECFCFFPLKTRPYSLRSHFLKMVCFSSELHCTYLPTIYTIITNTLIKMNS